MDGIKLEQLIRDFMAVGRELLEILRDLGDIEEDDDDQPPIDTQADEESQLN